LLATDGCIFWSRHDDPNRYSANEVSLLRCLADGREPAEAHLSRARTKTKVLQSPSSEGRSATAPRRPTPAAPAARLQRDVRRDEDPLPFRKPHRRTRRWIALADLSGRPRPHAELEARDYLILMVSDDRISFSRACRRRRQGARDSRRGKLAGRGGQDGFEEGQLRLCSVSSAGGEAPGAPGSVFMK